MWPESPADRKRDGEQPVEVSALLKRWDLELQAVEAFQQDDDVIRCCVVETSIC